MRLCQMCWKNLKNDPAKILYKENYKNSYLLCNECIKKDVIQDMINNDGYKLIYNCPAMNEREKK